MSNASSINSSIPPIIRMRVLKDLLDSTLKNIKNDEMLTRCQGLRQTLLVHDTTSFFQQLCDVIINLILEMMRQKPRK